MAGEKQRSARPFIPEKAGLSALKEAIQSCRGCDLYRYATQAVFGEGPEDARLFMVGEKPGDKEDLEGRPFVGPAGKLLRNALADAGIDSGEVYLTNVVKHFKFVQRDGRRLHKKPTGPEISACLPWLDAEMDLIRPEIIVCLGATAAQALMGKAARVTRIRGRFQRHRAAGLITATVHPSALLRMPEQEQRKEQYRLFVEDLVRARDRLKNQTGKG